ncbi:MAG: hypothetical protein N4A40_12740 [Tissierellales bacterium]|jgi:hypothetical protein|nr:hypothetical protein [Tissierellales bacterium]
MINILFALSQSEKKSNEERILSKYKETIDDCGFEYSREYDYNGIERKLAEEKFDVLVVNDHLEDRQMPLFIFDRITDKYPKLNIIVVARKDEDTNYVRGLYTLGIYNILYVESTTPTSVVNLITNPRGKLDAKHYLDIDDMGTANFDIDMSLIPDEQVESIIRNLKNDNKDCTVVFDEVVRTYDDKQITFLVSLLTDDVIEKLSKSGNDHFEKYQNRIRILNDEYVENNSHKEREVVEKVKTITKIEKEYINRIPSDYNKIVAFVGDRGNGTTTIVDFVARLFSEKKKKVAVIDLSMNNTLYYMKCWGNRDITEDQKNSLKNLTEGNITPIKVNEYYTLYTSEYSIIDSSNSNSNWLIDPDVDLFQAIEKIRYDNDIIIVDSDLSLNDKIDSNWLSYGLNSIYLVHDLNVLNIKQTKKKLRDFIDSGVNPMRTFLITNKYIKGKIGPKDILESIMNPIQYVENDTEENKINISKTHFKVNFDYEMYQDLISSYMYVGEKISIPAEVREQVNEICLHIYPDTSSAKKSGIFSKGKLKNLLSFRK